jgi:hypothetical protein
VAIRLRRTPFLVDDVASRALKHGGGMFLTCLHVRPVEDRGISASTIAFEEFMVAVGKYLLTVFPKSSKQSSPRKSSSVVSRTDAARKFGHPRIRSAINTEYPTFSRRPSVKCNCFTQGKQMSSRDFMFMLSPSLTCRKTFWCLPFFMLLRMRSGKERSCLPSSSSL